MNDSIEMFYFFYKRTEAKIKLIPRTSENLPRRAETWYLGLCSGLNYNFQIKMYLKLFGKVYLDLSLASGFLLVCRCSPRKG